MQPNSPKILTMDKQVSGFIKYITFLVERKLDFMSYDTIIIMVSTDIRRDLVGQNGNLEDNLIPEGLTPIECEKFKHSIMLYQKKIQDYYQPRRMTVLRSLFDEFFKNNCNWDFRPTFRKEYIKELVSYIQCDFPYELLPNHLIEDLLDVHNDTLKWNAKQVRLAAIKKSHIVGDVLSLDDVQFLVDFTKYL